jgi:excisionase family DNA binding protein
MEKKIAHVGARSQPSSALHGRSGEANGNEAAPARLCYSIGECAELLTVSPGTIRNLLARGELKSARVARRVVVLASSVAALLGEEKAG